MFDDFHGPKDWAAWAIGLFCAAVFLDSLRFKFSDHPKTQQIFGRLDAWAGEHGAPGLFSHTGLFSQYTIGLAELVASAFLLTGLFVAPFGFLVAPGALLGLGIMSGAIGFHLLTPLGVDPNRDGGGLLRAAVLVWVGCLVLLVLRRDEVRIFAAKIQMFIAPLGA